MFFIHNFVSLEEYSLPPQRTRKLPNRSKMPQLRVIVCASNLLNINYFQLGESTPRPEKYEDIQLCVTRVNPVKISLLSEIREHGGGVVATPGWSDA